MKYRVKTLFAGLHLINRVLNISTVKNLQIVGCMCIYIVSIITERSLDSLESLVSISRYAFTKKEGEKTIIKILKEVNCITLPPISWDYASCYEDLIPMLYDMLKCDYDPYRTRKLLLTKKQIRRWDKSLKTKGNTIVPIKLFVSKGKIKIEIALSRGKKNYDKREKIKYRDINRDTERAING